jgi:hypothetical protein
MIADSPGPTLGEVSPIPAVYAVYRLFRPLLRHSCTRKLNHPLEQLLDAIVAGTFIGIDETI